MNAQMRQYDLWGAPEPITSYPDSRKGRHDDAPVACERENLWPSDLVALLGPELLERLYGDIPRRTRLYAAEVCRRLRCDSQHVANLRDAGSLDACDISHPDSTVSEWRYYRYSLVRFLFGREWKQRNTRCNVSDEDQCAIERAVAQLARNASSSRKDGGR
jgi:hypothetical protein